MSETRSMTDTKDLVERSIQILGVCIEKRGMLSFAEMHDAKSALEAQAREIERFDGINEELGRLMNENAGLRSQLSTAHLSGEKAGLERAREICLRWKGESTSHYGRVAAEGIDRRIAAAYVSLHPSDNNAVSGWQTDIENAPFKVPLLVACPENGPYPIVAMRYALDWKNCSTGKFLSPEPTLWMHCEPLPQPPASKAEERK